jgi:arylsulfatase
MKRVLTTFGAILPCALLATPSHSQKTLPIPPERFQGDIQVKAVDSTPFFPAPVTPPAGAPNVLLVLLDDVGFGASSAFGGLVNTPTLNGLVKSGLRYTYFHTTALCSPTRAALLTGRNHHSAHSGAITEQATGYPGYDSLMWKDTATVAEILKQHGYNTAWFGKNHNVPDWHTSQAGPFDLWPTELGFEYFYGFIAGDTNQWRPAAFKMTQPIEPYLGKPDYNLDMDLAEQARSWIRLQNAMAPTKPFFLYYAPGATHAPHHPTDYYAHKYDGKFSMGWNEARNQIFANQKAMGIIPQNTVLTPTPSDIPSWDSVPPVARDTFARFMEVYAGYLEQTDTNVGRVIDAIAETGELDNTLIIYICGDNGASAEGTMQGLINENSAFNLIYEPLDYKIAHKDDIGTSLAYNHYPVGWAHAMCTPFQWEKQIASHFGGTRNGMVISWPAKIKATNQFRTQFHHVIDIAPTILEAVGVEEPTTVNGVKQRPMEGVSLKYTFDSSAASAPTRHKLQYFELYANRAIYSDGWVACTTPAKAPWQGDNYNYDVIDDYPWELYDIRNDFSEGVNLAAQQPAKLKGLQRLWDREARKFGVYPLDNSKNARLDPAVRPSLTTGRTSFTYYPDMIRLPEASVPVVKNKSWSLTAELTTKGGDNGMVITQGGLFGGWGLYFQDGKPVYHNNVVGQSHQSITGNPLPAGDHVVVFDFLFDGGAAGNGGMGTLIVDGVEVANDHITSTTPIRFALDEGGIDVGQDSGTPLNLEYDVPFKFTGDLTKVTIDLNLEQPAISADEQKRIDRQRRDMAVRRD